MSCTTPISRWYEDFLLDIRLDSRFFRNDSKKFHRETNATVFMSSNCPLDRNFKVLSRRNSFFRFDLNFECWFIGSCARGRKICFSLTIRIFIRIISINRESSTAILLLMQREKAFAPTLSHTNIFLSTFFFKFSITISAHKFLF